jgi:hypothetical protein
MATCATFARLAQYLREFSEVSHIFFKWPLANVGKSGESLQNCLANIRESGESRIFFEKGNFGKCEYSPKMDIFWRVLALAIFPCK